MDNIQSKLFDIIAKHAEIEAASLSLETAIDELGIDSLDTFDLVSDIEDVFRIQISDDELENMTTIGELVNLVSSRQRSELSPE